MAPFEGHDSQSERTSRKWSTAISTLLAKGENPDVA
jgi:hypothetical protein